MIKTTGKYMLSKDGGETWISVGNILVSGYYSLSDITNIKLSVGSGVTPPNYSDEGISVLAESDVFNSFSSVSKVDISQDYFAVEKERMFNFGVGHNLTISDVGLYGGSKLLSRALFTDVNGEPLQIKINAMDSLQIKYILKYTMPRSPFTSTLNYLGQEIDATVTLVNPDVWTSNVPGEPTAFIRAAAGNGFVADNNSRLISGSITGNASQLVVSKFADGVTKGVNGSFTTNEDEMIGDFDQLIFCDSTTPSYANAFALVQLDSPITKTDKNTFSAALTLYQRGQDGNT